VDGTGSGSCPVAGFGISGAEPSGSATKGLVSRSLGYLVNSIKFHSKTSLISKIKFLKIRNC
jgi:hypothetical protein